MLNEDYLFLGVSKFASTPSIPFNSTHSFRNRGWRRRFIDLSKIEDLSRGSTGVHLFYVI
jgi:hypothetical protein